MISCLKPIFELLLFRQQTRDYCDPGIPIIKPSGKGFTLIELMIAVAIVGILAAIAMPSFTYTIQNNRVKTAATDMHLSLLLARSEAIKRNDDVVLATATGGWQITYLDTDPDPDETLLLFKKDDLPSDVDLNRVCDGTCPPEITFERNGRAPDSKSIEMRFTSNANDNIPMRCVSLSLSGRPRVQTDTDSNPADGCD